MQGGWQGNTHRTFLETSISVQCRTNIFVFFLGSNLEPCLSKLMEFLEFTVSWRSSNKDPMCGFKKENQNADWQSKQEKYQRPHNVIQRKDNSLRPIRNVRGVVPSLRMTIRLRILVLLREMWSLNLPFFQPVSWRVAIYAYPSWTFPRTFDGGQIGQNS